ncbi:lamB/YcsF family protein [Oceanobacillus picturae]|uniref:5-oxoprolinase subunit A n=1 Tax=Oceanobacillus picturae TaxID=171693 RepID=A0A0U9HFZ1_9BACI|nr:5-oxoprolinase subunit PxpA [Oceanobacillus picturae]GAQ19176.1 lamB/YcsF family protein [Oceanobacillus picturae]
MNRTVDLNCDMGESFGVYTFGADEQLMKHITSANIACGAHAGDPNVMEDTVKLAKQNGVAIGAHPGYPDLAGFGRRKIELTDVEIYRHVLYQIGALHAFCKAQEVPMHHVKAHGALYNVAAKKKHVAHAIAQAVADFDQNLILYGLAGSYLVEEGKHLGLRVASEVFADRTYQEDGSLTPRNTPGALIETVDQAVKQVKGMLTEGHVTSVKGKILPIQADTVCVHGDGASAVRFVRELKTALQAEEILIESM